MKTIVEAKEHLRESWKEGTDCPCCGQHVQLYDYKLFATSAFALMKLYSLSEERPDIYFHISEYAEASKGSPRAPHFAELRFWGLISKQENSDPTKKSSGYWCITQKGREFVEGKILLPSRILVYNNKFQGFSDKASSIPIQEALGNKFDYAELMGRTDLQQGLLSWS